jgi:hypothetical protein
MESLWWYLLAGSLTSGVRRKGVLETSQWE